MKYSLFFNKTLLLVIAISIIFICAQAEVKVEVEESLKDITSKLRCMTCQNKTIYSSDAEFSLIIKEIIRKKLQNNETKKEIFNFLIYRYGEYIVFEPKMNKQNIFLWTFPFLILAISLVFFIIRVKKNT